MRLFTISFVLIYFTYAHPFEGFYTGIGGGVATLNMLPQNNTSFADGSTGNNITNTAAFAAYIGYQYNQFFVAQFEINAATNTKIASTFSTNQRLTGIYGIVSLPLDYIKPLFSVLSGVALYGKIGLNYNVINYFNVNSCVQCPSLPDSSFSYLPLYGGGISYDFKDFGIRAEFDYAPNNTVSKNSSPLFTTVSNYYLWSIYYKF